MCHKYSCVFISTYLYIYLCTICLLIRVSYLLWLVLQCRLSLFRHELFIRPKSLYCKIISSFCSSHFCGEQTFGQTFKVWPNVMGIIDHDLKIHKYIQIIFNILYLCLSMMWPTVICYKWMSRLSGRHHVLKLKNNLNSVVMGKYRCNIFHKSL